MDTNGLPLLATLGGRSTGNTVSTETHLQFHGDVVISLCGHFPGMSLAHTPPFFTNRKDAAMNTPIKILLQTTIETTLTSSSP